MIILGIILVLNLAFMLKINNWANDVKQYDKQNKIYN